VHSSSIFFIYLSLITSHEEPRVYRAARVPVCERVQLGVSAAGCVRGTALFGLLVTVTRSSVGSGAHSTDGGRAKANADCPSDRQPSRFAGPDRCPWAHALSRRQSPRVPTAAVNQVVLSGVNARSSRRSPSVPANRHQRR
jgi:hypothetical protein